MKLSQLFENANPEVLAKVVDIVAKLTSNSASHDGWREDMQTQFGEEFIEQVQQVIPEIIYNGNMFRTVSVEGLEPATLEEIKQHALATGVQSFARDRQGMENWLEQIYDTMEFNMSDTVLEQSGPGVSTEKLLQYLQQSGMADQFDNNVISAIERAASVTEVIAPYYSNIKVIDTQVFDVEGMYDEDEDDDY